MAKKIKPKMCRYGHCKHLTKEINLEHDNYEEENGRYYHMDCKIEKDTIAEIIDYWDKNITGKTSFSFLRKVINDIIYNKNYPADYVLFSLKRNASWLKSPGGLYYAIDDTKTKSSWEYQIKLEKFNKEKETVKMTKEDEPSFNFVNSQKTFGSIFGGK